MTAKNIGMALLAKNITGPERYAPVMEGMANNPTAAQRAQPSPLLIAQATTASSARPAATLNPAHTGKKVITILGAVTSSGLLAAGILTAAPFNTASMALNTRNGTTVKLNKPKTAATTRSEERRVGKECRS